MPNTILLVDDDSDFREEFRDYFAAYNIVEAQDGEKALAILKRPNEIDLVILDVRMPGIQGTDVLTEIKKQTPELGIIILTGNSSEDVAIEAVRGHADDYLQKPVDLAAVRESIEKLLEARAARSPGYSDDKIEKAKRYLERNCYAMVSLKDASEAVALSSKYLSRLFIKNTGMGFKEYSLSLRLKEAKRLLTATSLNIEQISDKLGYQNIESLTRLFKKMTGLTPLAYRKKFKGNKQAKEKKKPAPKKRGKR
jgi:YesN/AraC family two-component response regulator